MLDRPISEPNAAADAIRWPVVEPDRDVRCFQSVLLDLGARLGLPGMVDENGDPKFADYADYIVNHQRKPGVGPLAGFRGARWAALPPLLVGSACPVSAGIRRVRRYGVPMPESAIADGKVAAIHFTLTLDDGEVADTSRGQEPMLYLHGTGMILPGLESALEGRAAGDHFQISIEPKDGFGERRDELQHEVAREEFDTIDDLEIGMQFNVPDHDEDDTIITVVEMTADTVTVDGNHALAGQTLNFDITVREVRAATQEEIAHGHPHGTGGCSH